MSELFSREWMQSYQEEWNSEPGLADELEKINFNSIIGYGFQGQDEPSGIIIVENGRILSIDLEEGQELNWDLRCTKATWESWFKNPPGMMKLGMAYTSGKLKFAVGDYGAMIRDPRMAGPFIKSFSVMAKVK